MLQIDDVDTFANQAGGDIRMLVGERENDDEDDGTRSKVDDGGDHNRLFE